jgi:hypothetical protein
MTELARFLKLQVTAVTEARKGLANGYMRNWLETAWRPDRNTCENYGVEVTGTCTGDHFCKSWPVLSCSLSCF